MTGQAFSPALTQVDSTPQAPLGTIYELDNKAYKYVKFTGTQAVAIGDVLCYILSDTTLTTVDTNNTEVGAGVSPAVHTIASVSYGWIQIRGVCVLASAIGGSDSAGNKLCVTSATDGTLTVATAVTDAQVAICVVSATPLVQLCFPN